MREMVRHACEAQARTYHTLIRVCMHRTLRNVQLFVVVVSELIAENTAKLQYIYIGCMRQSEGHKHITKKL